MSAFVLLYILQDLCVVTEYCDAAASTLVPWLDNPQVLVSVYRELSEVFLQLLDNLLREVEEQRVLGLHIDLVWLAYLVLALEEQPILVS